MVAMTPLLRFMFCDNVIICLLKCVCRIW